MKAFQVEDCILPKGWSWNTIENVDGKWKLEARTNPDVNLRNVFIGTKTILFVTVTSSNLKSAFTKVIDSIEKNLVEYKDF